MATESHQKPQESPHPGDLACTVQALLSARAPTGAHPREGQTGPSLPSLECAAHTLAAGKVRGGRALFLQSHGGWEATSKWAPSSPGIPYLRRGHQGPERRSGSLKVPVFSASHGDRGQVCPARPVIGHRMLGEAGPLGRAIGDDSWWGAGHGGQCTKGVMDHQGVGTLWKAKQTVAGADGSAPYGALSYTGGA